MKKAWETRKTARKNFTEMGLAYDVNKIFKIPNIKERLKKQFSNAKSTSKWKEETLEEPIKPTKHYVIEELEKEAKAPRKRKFSLPKGQIEWLTYMLDKYDFNYKAMVRDKRNYNQYTWKQIRAKVKVFMGVPEQFIPWWESKGKDDKELLLAMQNQDNDSD